MKRKENSDFMGVFRAVSFENETKWNRMQLRRVEINSEMLYVEKTKYNRFRDLNNKIIKMFLEKYKTKFFFLKQIEMMMLRIKRSTLFGKGTMKNK